MENLLGCWFHQLLSFYISINATILRNIFNPLIHFKWQPIFVPLLDSILSVYFRYCHLQPCTLDLDMQTTLHFWTPAHRKINKPNLVLVHGFGGNSKFQFLFQIGTLARSFNLYIPDLLFFGKSYTRSPDRTDAFQAKCLSEGLRRLGVDRYSIYGISYGGYVAYRTAAMSSEAVDKVVILSSGIGMTEDQKEEHLRNIGRNAVDILLPRKPADLRLLVTLSLCNCNFINWVPDYFLREFITVMCNTIRKEKSELVEHLLAKKADSSLPILDQGTLLIWGDKDMVFPLVCGRELHRHLGSKAKMEILENAGHAANLESSYLVNESIKAFLLNCSAKRGGCTLVERQRSSTNGLHLLNAHFTGA
ncbi:uncharacterized protein LOC113768094 [Coffea eugenioides]|uniref:AB hydrolase-1 domain-containing protein n=1 Tax=Coffea arabica TaxID=13443 RepID=A0A6P6XKA7_COFAR|nr:uncharacterized protein LOC113742744 [Coffea arabica]XP_027168132.1 uncharacterized protein LOC113768094 [Coffea eugenioides]